MILKNCSLHISTAGNTDIIDISEKISEMLQGSGVKDGNVTIFVPGSTGAVTTIEYERGVIEDMKDVLDKLVPENKNYKHNLAWGDGNGHSHIRSALLGPSLTVPIINGELILGTWQQIVLIDLDNRPRNRILIIQFMGNN